MVTDTVPHDAAAEEARAQAEARRQRILEKSNQRMGLVAGEHSDIPTEEAQHEATARAKMQALRRRRFKQAAASREIEEEKTAQNSTVEMAEKPEEETAPVDDRGTADGETDVAIAAEEETRKKYKGVAKMRRQMVKQKQEKAASKPTESVSTKLPVIPKSHVNRLPILFHLLTTILLFLAGLDIGLNQMVDKDVTIHRQLASQQYGVGIINGGAAYLEGDASSVFRGEAHPEWSKATQQDEFATTEKDEEEYEPSIDPLFRVDLDVLTKGEGIFLTLARGAVVVHRLLLRIFYFTPLAFFSAILLIPHRLWTTPPVLCLVSLGIRQGSKILLGAGIPSLGDDKSKDVLDMIKTSVLNFFANSFPTAVTFFDIFNHLRSDMYVILCGVFVGLVLTHQSEDEGSAAKTGTGDEL